jgi:hypothetical protein
LALSIVNTTSVLPAHHDFNSATAINGAQPQQPAGVRAAAAGGVATAALSTAAAVKPATRLAGANPVARGIDAGAAARFATNPVSTGPAAASAFDYAKAISAYRAQSTVAANLVSAAAGPGGAAPGGAAPGDSAPGDTGKGAVAGTHAESPHAGHATGGAHQLNAAQPAGDNSPAAPRAADDLTGSNDNAAVKAANAQPSGNQLEAGGQANPIAAPTAHAVMSLLKMI